MNISNTNTNGSNRSSDLTSPSVQLKVPKALLGGIYEVTSEKYNNTSNASDKEVREFKLKETQKVTDVGDTIIDIDLERNIVKDKILVKGQTSTLVQQPSRPIRILR